MQVRFSPDFDRQFIRRLTARQQIKALDVLELFQDEPLHKDLRNHSLNFPRAHARGIACFKIT